ncbi:MULTISPECIES: CotO family spore coat protein [Bacillus]|uniref:CotO family spore coat protein n=1 Tax=Bacillus TaxID=1386 RepID=UPI000BB6AE81|nr:MULTISPECIES: CotO family spore coat protein [Bacillus]
MKESKHVTTNPVMYIAQPNLNIPSPKMQNNFISEKMSTDKPKPVLVDEDFVEYNQENATDKEQEEVVLDKGKQLIEGSESKKKVATKPLKEMTIDEKVIYLTNLPKYITHIPCLIVVENENIVGYIKERVNDTILVDLSTDLSLAVIDIKDIKEIHLYVRK